MEKVIEIKKLHKSFKVGKEEVNILKNINLDIYKGKFLSIMGPSGCGKSTLLYLLGGLDKPTSGNIYINNKEINKKLYNILNICKLKLFLTNKLLYVYIIIYYENKYLYFNKL